MCAVWYMCAHVCIRCNSLCCNIPCHNKLHTDVVVCVVCHKRALLIWNILYLGVLLAICAHVVKHPNAPWAITKRQLMPLAIAKNREPQTRIAFYAFA